MVKNNRLCKETGCAKGSPFLILYVNLKFSDIYIIYII